MDEWKQNLDAIEKDRSELKARADLFDYTLQPIEELPVCFAAVCSSVTRM